MSLVTCPSCLRQFSRPQADTWKILCIDCWKATKTKTKTTTRVALPDPLRAELAGNMRALLALCHPDRHNGSPLSTKVTAWLLDVRKRVADCEGVTS